MRSWQGRGSLAGPGGGAELLAESLRTRAAWRGSSGDVARSWRSAVLFQGPGGMAVLFTGPYAGPLTGPRRVLGGGAGPLAESLRTRAAWQGPSGDVAGSWRSAVLFQGPGWIAVLLTRPYAKARGPGEGVTGSWRGDGIKELSANDRFEKNTLLVVGMKKAEKGVKRRKTQGRELR